MSTSYRGAVRQLLRDRLLDAGRDQFGERTWAQVTMAEIATVAGVSRQTLYNEFHAELRRARLEFPATRIRPLSAHRPR